MTCASKLAGDVWKHCGPISYILNFWVYKFCLGQLLESIKDKVILIEQYFEKMKWEPFFFFFFDEKSNSVKSSLDNSNEPKIEAETGEFRIFFF